MVESHLPFPMYVGCLNMNSKLRIHWRVNDKLEIISEIYSVIDEAL